MEHPDSSIPPDDIEAMRSACASIVGLTADHFEQLQETKQFTREEAFELTCQFHWARVNPCGDDE